MTGTERGWRKCPGLYQEQTSCTCVGGELKWSAEISIASCCSCSHMEDVRSQRVQAFDICVSGGRFHNAVATLILVLIGGGESRGRANKHASHSSMSLETRPTTKSIMRISLMETGCSKGFLKAVLCFSIIIFNDTGLRWAFLFWPFFSAW